MGAVASGLRPLSVKERPDSLAESCRGVMDVGSFRGGGVGMRGEVDFKETKVWWEGLEGKYRDGRRPDQFPDLFPLSFLH